VRGAHARPFGAFAGDETARRAQGGLRIKGKQWEAFGGSGLHRVVPAIIAGQ
jgi:hypothetical protein